MKLSQINRSTAIEDYNDIVGKDIGIFNVLEYLGTTETYSKSTAKVQRVFYDHHYSVRCTTCGETSVMSRRQLSMHVSYAKNTCSVCSVRAKQKNATNRFTKETLEKGVDSRSKNPISLSNNISTGIKHYTIAKLRSGAYQHKIRVEVDNKVYHCFVTTNKSSELIERAVELADEINNVMMLGGQDAFIEWYENFRKLRSE